MQGNLILEEVCQFLVSTYIDDNLYKYVDEEIVKQSTDNLYSICAFTGSQVSVLRSNV